MKRILPLLFIFTFQLCYSQWEPCNNGMWGGGNISALASQNNVMCAGTPNGAIYVSTDYGENWDIRANVPRNPKYSPSGIASIAINNNIMAAYSVFDLIISIDAGKTWTKKTDKLKQWPIGALIIKGDSIYLLVYNGGRYDLLLSPDYGETWSKINNLNNIESIASENGNIYAIAMNKICISTDGGANWDIKDIDSPSNEFYLISVGQGNIIVIGKDKIYYSSDTAKTWTINNYNKLNLGASHFILNGETIYAHTINSNSHLFKSTDSCKSWTQVEGFEINPHIESCTVTNNTLYIGVQNRGVVASTDGGIHWIDKNNGLTITRIYSLAAEGKTLYAASQNHGIYNSTDNGDNWTLKMPTAMSVLIDGKNIWIGTQLSTDNGQNWIDKWPSVGAWVCPKGDTVWLSAKDGIYLSTNKGDDWTKKNTFTSASTMATNGPVLFIGRTSNSGQLLTTDFGNKWKWLDAGLGCSDVISSILTKNYIMFGTLSCGFYKSSDLGSTWTQINNGMNDTVISALVCRGPNIFAGTDRGVYVSHDYGDSWTLINTGLPPLRVEELAIGSEYLYASVFESGVYRIKLEGLISVEEEALPENETAELIGFYTILGEKLQNIDGYHGLLLKVLMKDGKMVSEKIVLE